MKKTEKIQKKTAAKTSKGNSKVGDVTLAELTAYLKVVLADTFATKEHIDNAFATKEYLDGTFATKEHIGKTFATKEYLDGTFATKEHLDGTFATKEDIGKTFATKEYIDRTFATKEHIENTFATKEYLDGTFATKDYIEESFEKFAIMMQTEFSAIHEKLSDHDKQFIIINKRLDAHDLRFAELHMDLFDFKNETRKNFDRILAKSEAVDEIVGNHEKRIVVLERA